MNAWSQAKNAFKALLPVILLLCPACSQDVSAPPKPFPPLYTEAQPFLKAISQARTATPLPCRVTGLTVPHHLLAADLMAEAFALVSRQNYRRIIILSPDHFNRSPTPFAVSVRSFQTLMGEVPIDGAAVTRLQENPLVSASNLFSHEHGVRVLLPLVAHYFPRTPVVAIALRQDSQMTQWDALAQSLAPLLTADTLLVQSTDFSHYLPWARARQYDQETLRVLSAGDPEAVSGFMQPQHLDSRGAQYLQLRLQREAYQARPAVVASRNSQEYTTEPLASTTSYLVQVYSPEPVPITGAQRFYFGGDTFFGRFLADKLARETWRRGLINRVRQVTGGAPLIVNLEGVVLPQVPADSGPRKLGMAARPCLDILQALNVVAVSVANNHSHDFGEVAYAAMVKLLSGVGITVLTNGCVTDLGPFRITALTDLDNQPPYRALLGDGNLVRLQGLSADKPLFAFLHWGDEYAAGPETREQAVAARLRDLGVELIIGCHTHRAAGLNSTQTQCQAFSLGNFIFDQMDPRVSGALLEVVFYPQGTYFLRLIPLGNLYGQNLTMRLETQGR